MAECPVAGVHGHMPPFAVSNKVVINLFRKQDKDCDYTLKTAYGWLRDKYGDRWPEEPPSVQAVSTSVKRAEARLTRLKKQHNGPDKTVAIQDFLEQDFQLPRLGLHKGRLQHFSPVKLPKASRRQGSASQKQSTQLARHDLGDIKKKMYAATRNANKRLRCKDGIIRDQKEKNIGADSTHTSI